MHIGNTRTLLVALASGGCLSCSALADVLEVPAQFPTIQSALDVAVDGDEVRVAPGIYAEAIDFLGKQVAVVAADGPASTTIDATGLPAPAITIIGASGTGARVRGFTIIAGQGFADPLDPSLTFGGGLYVQDGQFSLENAVVRGGNVTVSGGGLYALDASGLIENCRFEGNVADEVALNSGRGGGVAIFGSIIEPDVRIVGTEFVENSTGNTGGGLSIVGAKATVNGGIFERNNGDERGGGVFVLEGDLRVTDVRFVDNTSIRGGAIHFNRDGIGILRDSLFTGNTSATSGSRGGALYALSTTFSDPDAAVVVEACTFEGNIASGGDGRGAAIYSTFSSTSGPGEFMVRDTRFIDNSATQRGAAVYASGGNVRLMDCEMVGNTATQRGGAVYVASGGTVSIEGGSIQRGSAGDAGGAIYALRGNLSIRDVRIAENDAFRGGGIAIFASSSGGSTLDMADVTLVGNEANSFGGALGISGSTTTVTADGLTIVGNRSRFSDSAGITVTSGEADLRNVLIADNQAIDGFIGTALYMEGLASVTLTNATISGNRNPGVIAPIGGPSPLGAGILRMTNAIVWDNDGDIAIDHDPSQADVAYSIVEGGFPGTQVLDLEPGFIDALGGNYDLAAGSPAIDAGQNAAAAGLTTDILGRPRFVDDPSTPDTGAGTAPIIDIGAFEFQGEPCRADIDGDGELTIFDFLEFQNLFAAGDLRADFDGDGELTIFDFLVFQNEFAAGCP